MKMYVQDFSGGPVARVCLPMDGGEHGFDPWFWNSTCLEATRPVLHDSGARKPWSPRSATGEAAAMRSLGAAPREEPSQHQRPSAAKQGQALKELLWQLSTATATKGTSLVGHFF